MISGGFQMFPRCLPDVSQMSPRCLPDVFQMSPRCLLLYDVFNVFLQNCCLGSYAWVIYTKNSVRCSRGLGSFRAFVAFWARKHWQLPHGSPSSHCGAARNSLRTLNLEACCQGSSDTNALHGTLHGNLHNRPLILVCTGSWRSCESEAQPQPTLAREMV